MKLWENKKILCSYPFNSLFLSGNAEIKFCCASRTILGNANVDKISEAMLNEKAQEVREYMLRNEWHPNCKICKEIEEVNGRSTRTGDMYNFKEEDVRADVFKLEHIDLRWNNTCNLTCNYCVPEFSHKWAKIKGEKIVKIHKDNETDLFEFIEKHKNTVTKIMILGGEPLLHRQNLRLTDIVPDAFYYLLTNLSLENLEENEIANKFLGIKHFDWGVSFETIGPRFEYVRHGANWETFDKNLKYIQQKANEQGFRFSAHPLYFLCSAFNVVEYYDYVYENNLFNGGVWWQSIIHNGGGALNHMTKKIKHEAIEEIERCKKKYPDAPGLSILEQLKEQMIEDLSLPDDPSYIQSVIKEYDDLENIYLTDKKYKFKELWPEVNIWLEQGNKET